MAIDKANSFFELVDSEIGSANYKGALQHLELIESLQSEENNAYLLNIGELYIDVGYGLKNPLVTLKGLDYTKRLLDRLNEDHENYGEVLYAVANGLSNLIDYRQFIEEIYYLPNDPRLKEAKEYYRKAIWISQKKKTLAPEILVNYGTLLNGKIGRTIEAIEAFQQALEISHDHAMAKANLGYAKIGFSRIISGHARIIMLCEAYQGIKEAIPHILDKGPRDYFQKVLDNQQLLYSNDVLLQDVSCTQSMKQHGDKFRNFYRKFSHRNQLYLTLVSPSHVCEAALYDSFVFTRMNPNSDQIRFSHYAAYVNDIKQTYVCARTLCAQSFYCDSSFSFINEDNILFQTSERPIQSIHLEIGKAAYRTVMTVFDKIALTLNEYLNLGLMPTRLYFRDLSPFSKKMKNHEIMNTPLSNPFTSALFDLADDFSNGYLDYVHDLRNALEHRFQHIFHDKNIEYVSETHVNEVWMMALSDAVDSREESGILTMSSFESRLLEAMRYARSAIIYLICLIDWQEFHGAPTERSAN